MRFYFLSISPEKLGHQILITLRFGGDIRILKLNCLAGAQTMAACSGTQLVMLQ